MFFARPDVVFIAVWGFVLALYLPFPTNLTPPFNPNVVAMLGFNMLTAPLIFFLVRRRMRAVDGPEPNIRQLRLSNVDLRLTNEFLQRLMLVWVGLYTLLVVYSGGLPLIWAVMGIPKSYGDFGIPTLGGLNNMLRCFLGCIFILLFVQTRRWIYLCGWFLFLSLYVAEVTRGGLLVFLGHSVAIFLLTARLSFRRALLTVAFLLVGGIGFMGLGAVRGISFQTSVVETDYNLPTVSSDLLGIWLYATTSLGNLNYAANLGIEPTFLPNNIAAPIFPTVIRGILLPHTYPIPLVTPAFNTTTMYAPLVADFGFVIATLIVSGFQVLASYVYLRARRGSVFHLLLYPPLFVSLALGIIYIYMLSLVVLAYPWLCVWYRNFVLRRRAGVLEVMLRKARFQASPPLSREAP
jgi:oligosaccharide repeat unit polymerase